MRLKYISLSIWSLLLWLGNCKSPAETKTSLNVHSAAREKFIAEVNAQIKGREQAMVDSVFKNLQVLGGFPAENLVFAMDKWSQALGVDCSHCHNTSNWASDEKPQKAIARQMVNMGEMISAELRKIPELKSERPTVNCVTCHRGALKPALRMR